MEHKRIIVLANSIKRNGRCVAGREIGEKDGNTRNWLRPISDEVEGALMPQHMVINNGRQLEVLDIVDVPLTSNANDPCHPEDWGVANQAWQHVNAFDLDNLLSLEEAPHDLWLEDRSHTDRVTCGFLQRREHHQSLYLIRPRNLHIRLWKEFNEYKGYNQKKTRALFNYRNVDYNLSLTDPAVIARHYLTFPDVGELPNEFSFPCADKCLVCVSLTPVLNGYHYKVVATILELP